MHVGFLWNSRFDSQNYHNGRILSILEHHPSLQAVPDGAWAACFGCSRSCATASWGPEAVPRIGWVPLWTSCERTCCKRMQQDCASYHNIYLQISTNKGHGPPRYPSSNACNPFSLCGAAMCRKYEFLQRTRFSYCNAEYGCGLKKQGPTHPCCIGSLPLHSCRKFQTWNPNVDIITRQLWLQNDLRKRLPSMTKWVPYCVSAVNAGELPILMTAICIHACIYKESADKLFNPMVYWFLAIVDCCEAGGETQTHVFLKKWNQCKTCNITSIRFVVLGVCFAASLQSIRYFEMYLSNLVSFATSNVEPFGPLAPAWIVLWQIPEYGSKMAPDDQCQ